MLFDPSASWIGSAMCREEISIQSPVRGPTGCGTLAVCVASYGEMGPSSRSAAGVLMNITASTMPVTTVANPPNRASRRTQRRRRLSGSSIEVNPFERAGSPVVLGALEPEAKTAPRARPERETGDQQPETDNRQAENGERMRGAAGEWRACRRGAGDLAGLRLARPVAAAAIATATAAAVIAARAGCAGAAACRATEWRGQPGNRQAGGGWAGARRNAEGVERRRQAGA